MMVETNNSTNSIKTQRSDRQQQRGGKQGGNLAGNAKPIKLIFDPYSYDVSMDGNANNRAAASGFDAKRKQRQVASGVNRDAAMFDLSRGGTTTVMGGSDMMVSPRKKTKSPLSVAESRSLFKARSEASSTDGSGRGGGVFQSPADKMQAQKKKIADGIFRVNKQDGGGQRGDGRDAGGNVDMEGVGAEGMGEGYGDGEDYYGEEQEGQYEAEDDDEVQILGQSRAKFTTAARSSGRFDFCPTMGYNTIMETKEKPKIFKFDPLVFSSSEEEASQYEDDENEGDYDDEYEETQEPQSQRQRQQQQRQQQQRQTPSSNAMTNSVSGRPQSSLSAQFSTSRRTEPTATTTTAAKQAAKPAAKSADASGQGGVKTRGRGGSKFTSEDKFGKVDGLRIFCFLFGFLCGFIVAFCCCCCCWFGFSFDFGVGLDLVLDLVLFLFQVLGFVSVVVFVLVLD
jgi:hypothetical protein